MAYTDAVLRCGVAAAKASTPETSSGSSGGGAVKMRSSRGRCLMSTSSQPFYTGNDRAIIAHWFAQYKRAPPPRRARLPCSLALLLDYQAPGSSSRGAFFFRSSWTAFAAAACVTAHPVRGGIARLGAVTWRAEQQDTGRHPTHRAQRTARSGARRQNSGSGSGGSSSGGAAAAATMSGVPAAGVGGGDVGVDYAWLQVRF